MSDKELWKHRFEIRPNSWVFVPTEEASHFGSNLKNKLENQWVQPAYYFHLRNGGHVRALKTHVTNLYFIHLDIKNFFGSINRTRVTRCLKKYFSYSVARDAANHSTVIVPNDEQRRFVLPFGFVQSPILASICLRQSALGNLLERLHESEHVIVSVYMDDFIVSGNDLEYLCRTKREIKQAAKRSNFDLNLDKDDGPSRSISAFNIDLSHRSILVSDERLRLFENVYKNSGSKNQREGILGYISTISKEQANYITNSAEI